MDAMRRSIFGAMRDKAVAAMLAALAPVCRGDHLHGAADCRARCRRRRSPASRALPGARVDGQA